MLTKLFDASQTLMKYWGDEGKRVIAETTRNCCAPINKAEFFNHCHIDEWELGEIGRIVLGIEKLWPNVADAIPNYMGDHAMDCLRAITILCHVQWDD